MAGRLTISTVVYSKAFISKIWTNRAEFEKYERRGFFQFLYVTACGHMESIISDYLKSVLQYPLMSIKVMPDVGFPCRDIVRNDIRSSVSMEYEQQAVERILEKTMGDIDKAPFDKLESFHRTIAGCSIRDIVGVELYDHIKGLVSVRNLLAHGRQLYIEMDESFCADVGFEQHPLENAIKSLRQVGLFVEEQARSLQPDDVTGLIYDDDAVVHFWNASAIIAEIYSARAAQENLHPIGNFIYAIPKLDI